MLPTLVAQTNVAHFDSFTYEGQDMQLNRSLKNDEMFSLITPGFYPDPSICRRGSDYFMVNSTFSYYPGIPLFHSRDLVKWQQVGHVLNRPSQLKLDNLGLSSGIYAPAISYNIKNQTFYVITTVVGGIGNFIVMSKDPLKGDWSEPVHLPEVKGIDPSLFFDDDGRSYIVYSGVPIESRWYGQRCIWMFEFDVENNRIKGEQRLMVDGGVDPSKQPKWLEGPHIYKKQGQYYLIAAEGGTHEGHSQVAFRSDAILGPYKPCTINPILTQAGLPINRANKIINVGHADLIETPSGDWYSVFLGCRPYAGKMFNTGRETFFLPVTWKDNTPVILDNGKVIPTVIKKPEKRKKVAQGQTGNFIWRDDFQGKELGMEWLMLRTPSNSWYKLKDGKLELIPMSTTVQELKNPAFLARRQQHTNFSASTVMEFTPSVEGEAAGMLLFQNEKNYYFLAKIQKKEGMSLVLESCIEGKSDILFERAIKKKEQGTPITFSMRCQGGTCDFFYALKGEKLCVMKSQVDVTNLSTDKAKGFVGTVIGMYATTNIGSL